MFGKNLKYYRLKNNMTMKELADIVQISPMAISYYEKEERKPDMQTIKALAKALHVKVTDFLANRDSTLVFCHEEFRRNSKMSAKQQEYVREEVEEYFGRFYQAVNILGGEVLPKYPELHMLELADSADENASRMRMQLELSKDGPIGNLIEILENKGILVYLCNIENEDFSGMNGTVNGRPYIIINRNMSAERIRSTIAHEMAHFMFRWPGNMEDREIEKMANAISGSFLFPVNDVKRELGIKRSAITNDMIGVCKEYGISMYMLVMRANRSGIVNDYVAKTFYINANKAGWRKNEPSRIKGETPRLFDQLVYRAVTENEITAQKGAELLHESYEEVVKNCSAMEV
ncbi:MAG: XRE family transcriptional regulator [Lachnospiraceae bacterium]|nr:XRE family transcriptional regulator [Lachnospiraceae bacterium]